MRCCVNLLDFYERAGVISEIRFHDTYYFLEPGGRVSAFKAGRLPPPLHFAGALAGVSFLGLRDKIAIGRAMLAVRREFHHRKDLTGITMMDWLREKRQPPRAVARFWQQVLVSAVNEDLDRMSAAQALQIVFLGFLTSRNGHEMGVPLAPLRSLCESTVWQGLPNVRLEFRTPAERILIENGKVAGVRTAGGVVESDYYVSCVPFERLSGLVPELDLKTVGWEHSPITGIHLWFDRKVTDLPFGTLLDRTIQWFFSKEDGRYLQLVVSASRNLLQSSRKEVIEMARRELAEFLPLVAGATLEKAHVVKEVRATISDRPGLAAQRPGPVTKFDNLYLAGDWTATGWPSTMEGAVRSGYRAAEVVAAAAGIPRAFLKPDMP